MKTIVILMIFSSFLLCSCVTQSFITKDEYKMIPKGSEIIEVYSDQKPDDLFKNVYSLLLENGFRIEKENKEMHTISTDGKDIGQSTLGRFNIFIKENNSGSLLTLRSEWKPGADAQMMAGAMSGLNIYSQWNTARFGDTGRPDLVFSYSVSFAKKISNNIKYR